MENFKKGQMVEITGLPTGEGLSNKLIGRKGKITGIWNVPGEKGLRFYHVKLEKLPSERKIKEIKNLSENKIK